MGGQRAHIRRHLSHASNVFASTPILAEMVDLTEPHKAVVPSAVDTREMHNAQRGAVSPILSICPFSVKEKHRSTSACSVGQVIMG
jgi:hypothetical protein